MRTRSCEHTWVLWWPARSVYCRRSNTAVTSTVVMELVNCSVRTIRACYILTVPRVAIRITVARSYEEWPSAGVGCHSCSCSTSTSSACSSSLATSSCGGCLTLEYLSGCIIAEPRGRPFPASRFALPPSLTPPVPPARAAPAADDDEVDDRDDDDDEQPRRVALVRVLRFRRRLRASPRTSDNQ